MPTSLVQISIPDGTADAYLTIPEGAPRGGVLFLMDAFGLRPRIEEMADRIADRGYVVLAPNLFYRAGRDPVGPIPDFADAESRGAFFSKLRPLMEALTPERLAADGGAYLDFLAEHAPEPVAITGYCMGGRVGWRIAAAHPDRVAALGCFHTGGLVTEEAESPHLSAAHLAGTELLFGHADQDQNMTPEQIATLDQALDAAGVPYRSAVYEGALHGYTMSDTAVYDEGAAERHFDELFSLLERALPAPATA